MTFKSSPNHGASGFTLVELAMVLVVIGLLIGGILKGQELIANSRVTATVAQIKAIETANVTFTDIYRGIAGDLLGAQTLLQGCVAPCDQGDGNSRLNVDPQEATSAYTEGVMFFVHLGTVGLIDGVGAPVAVTPLVGQGLVGSNLARNASFRAGSSTANDFLNNAIGLAIATDPAVRLTAGTGGYNIKQNMISRLDGKMDDGFPDTGNVRGTGASGGPIRSDQQCSAGTPSVYNTANTETSNLIGCAVLIRLTK